MNENKEEWLSIIYYKRWAQMLMGMPAELRHKIHDAIDEYIISRTDPEDKNVLYSPYLAIKEQIDYDKQSYYNQVVERNRKNGKKGGRPKNNPNNPLGFQKPKKADTVTDTVTVCINNNIGESVDSPTALSFENIWSLYGKKGNKKTSERKWGKLSITAKEKALAYIPAYVEATPDKQYRKNFETFLNQECWNDELPSNDPINKTGYETKYRFID
ncbi:DUF6291 domain-containing protein [Parabacteroides johnsonii]|uniref:DUF6291 domain-containing protein n=1 Tax=Parabacteroides johnsonii TaxID=387661 RepID=UPI003AB61AD1